MKTNKKIMGIVIVVIIFSIGIFSGCISQATGEHMFLDYSVRVKWANKDIIQTCFISFYKVGNYTIFFSPDEFDNICCGDEHEYRITDEMLGCCSFDVELVPHPRVDEVEVTVSNGEETECYRFTG